MSYFPVVRSSANSSESGTSHAVTMPSGIEVDNLLVVFFGCDASTITVPSGWTVRGEQLNGTGVRRLAIITKRAEGSDTLTVTTSGTTASGHTAYRMETNNDIELAFFTNAGFGTTGDCPALTPAGGSQKYTWISAITFTGTLTSYPANYTNNQQDSASTNDTVSATRDLEASTEDPASFQWTTISTYITATVAVQQKTPIQATFDFLTRSFSLFTPSVNFAADATFNLLEMASTIFPIKGSASRKTKWTNETKPTTTWTNEQK